MERRTWIGRAVVGLTGLFVGTAKAEDTKKASRVFAVRFKYEHGNGLALLMTKEEDAKQWVSQHSEECYYTAWCLTKLGEDGEVRPIYE